MNALFSCQLSSDEVYARRTPASLAGLDPWLDPPSPAPAPAPPLSEMLASGIVWNELGLSHPRAASRSPVNRISGRWATCCRRYSGKFVHSDACYSCMGCCWRCCAALRSFVCSCRIGYRFVHSCLAQTVGGGGGETRLGGGALVRIPRRVPARPSSLRLKVVGV